MADRSSGRQQEKPRPALVPEGIEVQRGRLLRECAPRRQENNGHEPGVGKRVLDERSGLVADPFGKEGARDCAH